MRARTARLGGLVVFRGFSTRLVRTTSHLPRIISTHGRFGALRFSQKRNYAAEEQEPLFNLQFYEFENEHDFQNWKSKRPDGLPQDYDILPLDENMLAVQDTHTSTGHAAGMLFGGIGLILAIGLTAAWLVDPEKNLRFATRKTSEDYPFDGLWLACGGDPDVDPAEAADLRKFSSHYVNPGREELARKAGDKSFLAKLAAVRNG